MEEIEKKKPASGRFRPRKLDERALAGARGGSTVCDGNGDVHEFTDGSGGFADRFVGRWFTP